MPIIALPKHLDSGEKLVAVPHKIYEEFLAWQKKYKSARIFAPTAAEKKSLARARSNFRKGDYITLDNPGHGLGSAGR